MFTALHDEQISHFQHVEKRLSTKNIWLSHAISIKVHLKNLQQRFGVVVGGGICKLP